MQTLERMREEMERRRLASKMSPKLSSAAVPPPVPALLPAAGIPGDTQREQAPSRRADAIPDMTSRQPGLASSFSRFATDFEALGKLGKGGFGEVVKAQNKLDGVVYAIKVIKVCLNSWFACWLCSCCPFFTNLLALCVLWVCYSTVAVYVHALKGLALPCMLHQQDRFDSLAATARVFAHVLLGHTARYGCGAEYDIASLHMVSFYCFVTKACARRPCAAASA